MSSIRPDRRDWVNCFAFADLVPNSRLRDYLASDATPYGPGLPPMFRGAVPP
jgi:hypothetical protein